MKRQVLSGAMFAAVVLATVALKGPLAAYGVQYPTIDPNYAQQIYTGPLTGGPGMAWTTSGHLLNRNGSDILEYSPTQNTSFQLTSIHGVIATHTITGLNASGYGMTNGLDGYIYAVTGSGLQRFNPANWAAPAQSLAGTAGGAGYGVAVMPDGRIAYSDGFPTSSVYIYDPVGATNTLVYTAPANYLIDGIVSSPTGNLALAGQFAAGITIIDSSGNLINSWNTAHFPDGLAFSASASNTTLYSNNNDGTITRYVLGPGFTGTPTTLDIASGSGAYGDLASVGPDCAFYVSQAEHGNYHGATPGFGTNWDSGNTTADTSIVRIAGITFSTGVRQEVCEFYSPLEGYFATLPEPGTLLLLAGGLLPLLRRRSRA